MGWGRMGGVEVSLSLQADLCGIYILYNMGFFWKDFHIYLDMEKFFTLLGLRFLLFWPPSPCYPCPYTRKCVLDKKYSLPRYPPGICLLVDLKSFHIGVLLTKIWTVGCHGVTLIYVFPMVWGEDKVKNGKGNSSTNIYPWKNPKRLVETMIIILNMMQKMGCMTSLKCWS